MHIFTKYMHWYSLESPLAFINAWMNNCMESITFCTKWVFDHDARLEAT
jgi:hypothetical protein